jgi:hypothetical protein
LERGEKPVIGWREWVGLPELRIDHVKAKVDTGARSSTIHAFEVEPFRRRGARWVRFVLHPIQRDATETVRVEAPLVEERWVRNSGGGTELRPVIRTRVRFNGVSWPIELTLTRRDVMGFRMLLGREAVRGRFVVDPGRSYVAGRPERRRALRARSVRAR